MMCILCNSKANKAVMWNSQKGMRGFVWLWVKKKGITAHNYLRNLSACSPISLFLNADFSMSVRTEAFETFNCRIGYPGNDMNLSFKSTLTQKCPIIIYIYFVPLLLLDKSKSNWYFSSCTVKGVTHDSWKKFQLLLLLLPTLLTLRLL